MEPEQQILQPPVKSELQSPKAKSPRASKRSASPKPGTPGKARRRLHNSQLDASFCESGSDDDDMPGFGSSDEEDVMADPANIRIAARKLRELAILQEERQGPALAAFLEDADVVVEEYIVVNNYGPEELQGPAIGASVEDADVVVEEYTIVNNDGPVSGGHHEPNLIKVEAVEEAVAAGEAQVGEVAGSPPLDIFSWSEDFSSFSGQEEVYTRNPGPNFNCNMKPLNIFSLMWDVTILAKIVLHTNKYAWERIVDLTERGNLPKYLDLWVETTVDEIRKFFGLMIYMSLNHRSRIDEYWATGVLGMPHFRAIMSRNRFSMLLRFLHFVDNHDISPVMTTYEKRIAKVAPVFNYINEKFSSIYTPERELSLDESLLLWKGRLSWVQCIRSKAARFGIKSFELCEATSGYLLRSVLYAGKDSSFVQGAIHGFDNKTAKVVLELMDGYLDVGHVVVMDNWYNQLPLTRFLKSRHTDVLGTLNRNRKHMPEDIKNANDRRMQRGDQISRHCGDISITAWKDVKLVSILSTYHKNDQVVGRRGGQPLMKPVAIEAYNKSMGGVDLKDTKLSAYLMERKRGRCWYKKVFFRLLNTSILNAYILYKKNPVFHVLSHREFRYALAEALVSTPLLVPRPIGELRLSDPPVVDRLDGRGHLIAKSPDAPGSKRMRCVCCKAKGKRAQVRTICSKCKVGLCTDCFAEYHTPT